MVDKRREDNRRALVLVPPTGEGGRSWLVLKLQSLLKMEFAENKFPDDPDDLEEGDLGLESRAPRAPRQSRAQMVAPSDGDEAAASKAKQRSGRKRKPEWEEEISEPESETPSARRMRLASLERAIKWTSCSVGKSSARKTRSRTAAGSRAPCSTSSRGRAMRMTSTRRSRARTSAAI